MAGQGGTIDDDFIADEQLTLGAEEDERLPWLEAGDEDEDEGGVDTGRIVGFAMFAALALAALVGGIWWFGQRGPDPELVADGSTIQAPDGPYKTRPTDPGGKTFEGTGNLAPAVGEGEKREGRIAEVDVPAPSIDTPKAGATAAAPVASGIGVQVGAYTDKATAEAGWQKLQSRTDKLSGVSHRVVEGRADMGTVYRLQAVAGDLAGANALCAALKSDGVDCQVKR
ncbi:SPOR domain-containing protein [Altererythrobacter sp. TH136]|uniref:SPOR domain-containing protein n=1 Tax=Altererythrobacter sp. TH136 TaxID=2067415 RepID=UPI0011638235|nr:SPOR domain-containing protein [Altererythrobacter sp. TH136]QDM40549.1 SPOR domain-containing protein [Altererythrobacter sp. TH136]